MGGQPFMALTTSINMPQGYASPMGPGGPAGYAAPVPQVGTYNSVASQPIGMSAGAPVGYAAPVATYGSASSQPFGMNSPFATTSIHIGPNGQPAITTAGASAAPGTYIQ